MRGKGSRMSESVKIEDLVDHLRDIYRRQLVTVMAGIPTHEALQLADALLQSQIEALAGMQVRYSAKPPVDGASITEAWRRGVPLKEIMGAHQVSRATAYRFHPSRRGAEGGGKIVSQHP